MNSYGEVLRVIDGDTVVIRADYLPVPLKPELSLRIFGIDTPEKKGSCLWERERAVLAQKFTEEFVNGSVNVMIRDWDKYGGRVLGDLRKGDLLLSNELVRNGLAVHYEGGKKKSWCQ